MRVKRAGAFALLVSFAAGSMMIFAAQKRAGANSAPAYWSGEQSTGALLAGDACPIAVEEELLTVNIPEFPSLGEDMGKFTAYGASVTAKYTFRNPTAEDYTATLLFPFGHAPDYAPHGFDFYGDTARYKVKENGQDVELATRHSYSLRYPNAAFDTEKEIGNLEGEGDSFFRADTPVTEHTFHVTVPEAETEGHLVFLTLRFSVKADPAKTRIATSASSNLFVDKGVACIGYGFWQTRRDFDFSVYVFGEDATVKKKGVYDYAEDAIAGSDVEETGTTTGTYASFVAERYPGAESGVSEADWERGFTAALGTVVYGMLCTTPPDDITADDFMRWYEYDLEFPAGEEVVNEVTAPIYPSVHGSSTSRQYDYTYLLSPARKWADFGRLRVEIRTPYYLAKSSLQFEKTEGGYALDWEDGLPLGELTFTLAETEPQKTNTFTPYDGGGLDGVSIAVIATVSALAAGALVTTIVIVAVRHRRAAATGRGETTEGKIDLPAENPEEKHENHQK